MFLIFGDFESRCSYEIVLIQRKIFCSFRDLQYIISDHDIPLDSPTITKYGYEISSALDYTHSFGIAHLGESNKFLGQPTDPVLSKILFLVFQVQTFCLCQILIQEHFIVSFCHGCVSLGHLLKFRECIGGVLKFMRQQIHKY